MLIRRKEPASPAVTGPGASQMPGPTRACADPQGLIGQLTAHRQFRAFAIYGMSG